MALGCNCTQGLSNTGRPNCIPIQSVTSKLIMVPMFANDGTANRINLATPITATTWSALVNNADASKRWFPTPYFENVELPKAESKFEEANSGRMVFLRQGKRSFSGELWADDSSPTLLNKLQGNRCVDFGVYIVDINGNLVGSKNGNFLYPIPVDNPSFNPIYTFATDSTVSKIVVNFDFDQLFDEGTMYMINPTEGLIDFNTLNGMLDVNLTNVSNTANTRVFTAVLDYGTAINLIKFTGGVLADFNCVTVSTGVTFAITSVVENTAIPGQYTLTATAPFVVAAVYKISVVKTGYTGSYTFTA